MSVCWAHGSAAKTAELTEMPFGRHHCGTHWTMYYKIWTTGRALWRYLANTTEWFVRSGDMSLSNLCLVVLLIVQVVPCHWQTQKITENFQRSVPCYTALSYDVIHDVFVLSESRSGSVWNFGLSHRGRTGNETWSHRYTSAARWPLENNLIIWWAQVFCVPKFRH